MQQIDPTVLETEGFGVNVPAEQPRRFAPRSSTCAYMLMYEREDSGEHVWDGRCWQLRWKKGEPGVAFEDSFRGAPIMRVTFASTESARG